MLGRGKPAGEWLYPLLGMLALFLLSAVAVYVLTSVWREHAAPAGEPEAAAPKPGATLAATEILDRRLASGEITIAEYDALSEALARGRARAAASDGDPAPAAVASAVRAAA
ncbi:MAG TPA: hypothetical protein VL977_04535 [Solirubrobacteraceae bacterium]|nr:hypothetical protein [Solirubrobacteraceae bacterium]